MWELYLKGGQSQGLIHSLSPKVFHAKISNDNELFRLQFHEKI